MVRASSPCHHSFGSFPMMSVPGSSDNRRRADSWSPSAVAFVNRSMTRRISSDGSTRESVTNRGHVRNRDSIAAGGRERERRDLSECWEMSLVASRCQRRRLRERTLARRHRLREDANSMALEKNCRKHYRAPGSLQCKTQSSCGFALNPSGSSKPVRCGNPTLGRFDSGAAPSSRFRRVHADRGLRWERAAAARCSAQVRSSPPGSGENYRATIARSGRAGRQWCVGSHCSSVRRRLRADCHTPLDHALMG